MVKHLFQLIRNYWSTVLILCFSIVMIFILYLHHWHEDITANLGTELIGALVGFILINGAIEYHNKQIQVRERQKRFRALRVPLERHLRTLFFLKKSSEKKGNGDRDELLQILEEDFYMFLGRLDFAEEVAVQSTNKTWAEYLSREFSVFREALTAYLEKYSHVHSNKELELLEDLINHDLVELVEQSHELLQDSEINNQLLLDQDRSEAESEALRLLVNGYRDLLRNLSGKVNSSLGEQNKMGLKATWEQIVKPKPSQ
ncbi:MAG: hypothetical protein MI784_04225 [Cytophagales bacterium]|nr:hypothetical protein [Cytophagales bacterium]